MPIKTVDRLRAVLLAVKKLQASRSEATTPAIVDFTGRVQTSTVVYINWLKRACLLEMTGNTKSASYKLTALGEQVLSGQLLMHHSAGITTLWDAATSRMVKPIPLAPVEDVEAELRAALGGPAPATGKVLHVAPEADKPFWVPTAFERMTGRRSRRG